MATHSRLSGSLSTPSSQWGLPVPAWAAWLSSAWHCRAMQPELVWECFQKESKWLWWRRRWCDAYDTASISRAIYWPREMDTACHHPHFTDEEAEHRVTPWKRMCYSQPVWLTLLGQGAQKVPTDTEHLLIRRRTRYLEFTTTEP